MANEERKMTITQKNKEETLKARLMGRGGGGGGRQFERIKLKTVN